MVHGGGHHHHGGGGGGGNRSGGWSSSLGGGMGHHRHHYHGEGWFGGGRPYQSTNVVVVNQNRSVRVPIGGWNGPSYRQRTYHYHRSPDGCEECGERCCRTLCFCCVCCAATPAVRSTAAAPGMCKFFVISAVVFCILLVISEKNDSWTLNAGESRKISVPWLTRTLKIHSSADGTNVYALRHKCPKLKGPKIIIDNSIDVSLTPGDYQYDYFYLNAGSSLDVTIEQTYGAFNILLLRGKDTFDRWENDDDERNRDKKALLKRFVGANQKVSASYTVPASDFYVAVYDNAFNSNGHATISYHAELTTYKLKKISPVTTCDATNTCVVKTEDRKCILIQATMSDQTNQSDGVTVSISSDRKWEMLVFLSLVPLFIGWNKKRRCCAANVQDAGEQQEPAYAPIREGEQPVDDGDRPPAYAPEPTSIHSEPAFVPSVPSAPVEVPEEPPMVHAVAAVDYDSIAIPVENVIPVAPPPEPPTTGKR